jgi:hypothetical protein
MYTYVKVIPFLGAALSIADGRDTVGSIEVSENAPNKV